MLNSCFGLHIFIREAYVQFRQKASARQEVYHTGSLTDSRCLRNHMRSTQAAHRLLRHNGSTTAQALLLGISCYQILLYTVVSVLILSSAILLTSPYYNITLRRHKQDAC